MSTDIDSPAAPVKPDLAEHAAEIRRLGRRAVEDVIEIGHRLAVCKDILGHGNWLPWLEAEFGWGESTALNFMRLYELAQAKSLKFTDLNLPVSTLYLLAAPSTPEPVRDEILERAAAGERVFLAEVKQAIAGARKPKPAENGKDSKGRLAHKAKDPAMLAAANRAAARAKQTHQQQAHNQIADRIEDGAVGHPEQSAEARKRLYESQDRDDDEHDAGHEHDGDRQHDDVVDHVSGLGGEQVAPSVPEQQDAPADKILTVGDLWGPTTPVQTIREEVLMEYFAGANGAEIHTRIPRARRDEVVGEFLSELSIEKVLEVRGAELRARLPANPINALSRMDTPTFAETVNTAARGRVESVIQAMLDLNAPKGGKSQRSKPNKSSNTTQFPKLTLEPVGADAAGNPNFARAARNRSRGPGPNPRA